jgi:hypothetical protein
MLLPLLGTHLMLVPLAPATQGYQLDLGSKVVAASVRSSGGGVGGSNSGGGGYGGYGSTSQNSQSRGYGGYQAMGEDEDEHAGYGGRGMNGSVGGGRVGSGRNGSAMNGSGSGNKQQTADFLGFDNGDDNNNGE